MRGTMLVRCLGMMRGGGETRHLAWARELRQLGVDVEIVAGRPLVGAPACPIDPRDGVLLKSPYLRNLVYRLQGRRGFGRFSARMLHLDDEWFVGAAWRYLAARRDRPDIVHAHALHQAATRRRFDVPVVINLPGAPREIYRDDLREADALISDGWGAAHLPQQLGARVDDVPKGVDTRLFTPDGDSVRDRLGFGSAPVVLGVARMVPLKNVGLLADAFARVAARVPEARLVLAGDGPERAAIERKVGAARCADRVVFAGAIAHDDLPRWYRAADVFALSSTFDNSPNVVLEAMACGVPVVATDVGGVSQYMKNVRNGTLVPPNDPAALADALVSLLTDRARAQAIGRQNRADATNGFSWRASAERLLSVYERVLAQRGAARRGGRRVARA